MKICSRCGHEQSEGNFCGKCGAPLTTAVPEIDETPETAATYTEPIEPEPRPQPQAAQPNEQIKKLKSESKQFFSFFLQQLKTPSLHLDQVQSGLKNSLISMIAYILITSLAVYSFMHSVFYGGFGMMGPSILTIIFYMALLFVLILAVNITSVFVTARLFSDPLTFKEATRKIGGFFVLPLALSTAALILGLLQSYTISMLLLYLGVILAFGTAPMFVMIHLLSRKSRGIDGFYAFLFYLAFTALIGFFISLFVMDSAIGELLGWMDMGF